MERPLHLRAIEVEVARDLLNQVARVDGTLHVQSLAVVDHVLLARPFGNLSGFLQLIKGRERRFVCEVVFGRNHDPASEWTSFTRHRRGRDELD